MTEFRSDAGDNVTNLIGYETPGIEDNTIQQTPLYKSKRKLSRVGSMSWFNKSFDQNYLQQTSKPVTPRGVRRQNSVTDFLQNVLTKSKSHLQDIFALKKEKPKNKPVTVVDTVIRSATPDLKMKNININEAEGGCYESLQQHGLNPDMRHSEFHNSCPSFCKNEDVLTIPIILKHNGSFNIDSRVRLREKRRFAETVKLKPSTNLIPNNSSFTVTEPESVGATFEESSVDFSSSHRPIVKKQNLQLSTQSNHTSKMKLKYSVSSLIYPSAGKRKQSPKLSYNKQGASKMATLSPLESPYDVEGKIVIRNVSSAPQSPQRVCTLSESHDTSDAVLRIKRTLVKSNSDSTTNHNSSSQSLVKASSEGICSKTSTTSSLASSMISLGNIMISVTEYVYLGSVEAAYNEPLLCKYNISSLIDMTNVNPTLVPPNKKTDCPCACANNTHFRSKLNIGVDDIEWENLEQYFEDINNFIHGARKNGRRVLVFSYLGQSRAPAAVIQHIMHHFKISYKTALNIVQSKWPQTKLNSGFVKLLLRLEKRLGLQDSDSEIGFIESNTPEQLSMVSSGSVEILNIISAPPVVRGAWLEC